LSDTIPLALAADYAKLGYVANPFATADSSGDEPYWMRLVTRAAANRLLSATLRARERSVPVLVSMVEEVPEYYYRVAQNDFLSRTSADPSLGMMALNIPLEMMRLGRIRGTLAELAELVAAVDLPVTLSEWFAAQLAAPDTDVPEYALVTQEDLAAAAAEFAADPHAAVQRYLGVRAEPVSVAELDAAVHEAYLRQVAQMVDPSKEQEGPEQVPGIAAMQVADESADDEAESGPGSDGRMRDYLLALTRVRLSPVLSRAFAGYGSYGESLMAQEMKVTKAPRKTLAAVLRLMNGRWDNVVVMYDGFDSWPLLDVQTKMDVLASFMELRYIIAESGVMVVATLKGKTAELQEQFAAGEQVDWSMPELTPMYNGDVALDTDRVQAWLDAASCGGTSPLRADGPELAPLVEAASGDIGAFSIMAEAAFRDAASRAVTTLDAEAITAGLSAREAGSAS